ncbi:tape measure protein [Streptomyces phage SparkleGoddess]|uniref:Tape measure protein n=1 Tax=Streptomyces phage SparkleGoddess TaxID=2283305 RepID=A0A345MDX3_9CAUD|nr:tape measure protein [Streptomyces phage SparkleGoddess]
MQRTMASGALSMADVNTARAGFTQAANATGQLATQAVRARTETSLLTEAIAKGDLGYRQSMRVRQQFNNILREQYQLQRATAVQWTQSTNGRMTADLVIPRTASAAMNAYTGSIAANSRALITNIGNMTAWSAAARVMQMRIGLASAAMVASSEAMVKWGKNTQWAGRQLMVGFTIPLMAFGAVAGKAAYDVDAAMTRIAKVYDTTATSVAGKQRELDSLRSESMNMATQVAKKYGQSVKDTLDIEAQLAATGLKGQELQQSTVQVTRAATLGELERQDAIKATISLQSVYNEEWQKTGGLAKNTAEAFEYMNAMENATSLSMQDFVEAIPRGAGVLKGLGVGLREMGPLLVALKQQGISAAEGMNGLRSSAQRLLLITPQAEDMWSKYLPNKGTLQSIVDQTEGQFIPTLEKMADAMEGLKPYQRQQILTKVFNVYQNNKMLAVLDGLTNKTGQVATAFKVMNQDATKNALTAQQELDRMAESASGKFKRALENLKAQMAVLGEPFLEAASEIVGFISKLVDMFNAMPGPLKKFLSYMVIFGAIVGPIIMLVGLFANLIGNIFKLAGTVGVLLSRFRPLTMEQRAQQLLANQSSLAWNNQARAAQALSMQLTTLTAQMERTAIAQMQMNGTAITRFGNTTPNYATNIGGIGPAAPPTNSPYGVNAAGRNYNTTTGRLVSQAEVNAYASAQAAAARSSAQTAANTTTTRRNWNGIATSMGAVGVAAAGMALMTGSSSQMMNNIMAAVLAASLLGPMLVKAFRSAGIAAAAANVAGAFSFGRATGAAAGAGRAGAVGQGLLAALPAAGRLGMVIARFAGPAGLLATGAYMAYKLYGNMKKGIETQKRINESAKDWGDILGFVYHEAGEITTQEGKTKSTLDAQVTKMKEKNKELVKSLQLAKAAGDQEKAVNLAISEGLKVRNHGGSANDAMNAARISLRAAGYTSQEIEPLIQEIKVKVNFEDAKSTMKAQMKEFASTFNKVANNEFGQGGWEGFTRAFSGTGEINQNAAERGKGMAKEFWTAFQAQNDMSSRRNYFDEFYKSVGKENKIAWGRLGNDNREDLKKAGIESWREFANAYRDAQDMTDIEFRNTWADGDIEKANELKRALRGLGGETREYAEKHMDAEKFVAREIAKKNNMSDEEIKKIHSLDDLYGKLDMALMTVADAQATYKRVLSQAYRDQGNLSKKEQLRILNIYRVNAGLEKAKSVEQGFGDVIDSTTGKVKDNANALQEAAVSVDDWNNSRQKAMSGAMDTVLSEADEIWQERADREISAIEASGERRENALDSAAERQDARFDARAEAADKRFDKRSKNLDKRWDKIMEDFDNRWDARIKREEAAYNKKIDNIKKAIAAEEKAEETRQKIFEAEKTRMERMAAMANQNIDFNVAVNTGNLDEAAKIANNMQSTTDSWTLDDAAASSQDQSDARKQKMEGQITTLEAQRDKRIESLKKVEEAEKKALEAKKVREQEALAAERERYNKALEAERERYRKGIEAQKKAIQEQTRRDVEAKRRELDRMKKTLEQELLAVRASIPRNKKEYQKQISTIEGLYKKYGVNLKSQGNRWADTIGNALTSHVKEAAADIKNKIAWGSVANKVTQEMVDGGFNLTTSQFMKWVTTGELPKSYKAPSKPKTRHKGGPVSGNSKYDNRGGRHWGAGLRRDESFALLKNDEYVLNGKAHKMLGTSNLDRINKGDVGTGGIGGASDGLGLLGAFAAGMEGMYESAAQMAIESAGNQAMGFGIDGMAIAGAAGMYGNVRLSNEQLSNAAAIIGVGKSLGATTRDNIIAIMTAMQESTLRNLTYGDRDSVGLFQQRNAWGSFADRTNPSKAARMFFLGGAAGQRGLFDFPNRAKMSLAQAAQAVQVSAFPSAYAKWEDMARAVVSGTGFQPFGGTGGGTKRRPVNSPVSRSYANHSNLPRATDFGSPVGTPVRAAMNGVVTTSADLRSGNGYRSYGRYIVIQGGNEKTLYAHLSDRGVGVGRQVRAGQLIGYSGNTGNSSGPHLHFETWRNGKTVSPGAFGIPGMKTGGFTLNDGLAMLHKNETVLTAPLSEQLKSGIQNIDQGTNNEYNVSITFEGPVNSELDIERAVTKAINKRESKLGRNRSITT